jgi:superfamily I DNA and RNA helicase
VDKVINAHIDKIEEIERQIESIIEEEMAQIDIDFVVSDPQAALTEIAENIKKVFLNKYAHEAIELGFDFGRLIQNKIEQDKTIKIDNSKDPTLNAESGSSKQD